jgi:hypothetical protein
VTARHKFSLCFRNSAFCRRKKAAATEQHFAKPNDVAPSGTYGGRRQSRRHSPSPTALLFPDKPDVTSNGLSIGRLPDEALAFVPVKG